jgi:P4 family phage/plasmid primase-like protien
MNRSNSPRQKQADTAAAASACAEKPARRVGLTLTINRTTRKLEPSEVTAESCKQLLDDLAAEPEGGLDLTIDGLAEWPAESQAALWSMWLAVKSRRPIVLRTYKKRHESPLDLALAKVKKTNDPESQGQQVKATAIAIAHGYGADAQEPCIARVVEHLKRLRIGGYTAKKIEKLIKASGEASSANVSAGQGGADPTLLAADIRDHLRSTLKNSTASDDARVLHYFNGGFFEWDGIWRPIGPDEMRARVVGYLQEHVPGVAIKAPLVRDILLNLQGLGAVGQGEEPLPFYIDEYGPPTQIRRRKLLPFVNGMLDLEKLAAGKNPKLLKHDPRWFGTTMLPYNFDPNATCPQFLRFLARVLERSGRPRHDGDRRLELLQEWFGYSLLCDGRFQKFLLMIGEGNNGKGVIQNIWIRMLGAANVSHVSLDQFGDTFGLQPLIGKLANICGDLNEIDGVAEGVLKRLTGQDNISVNIKNRPAVTLAPAVKLIFGTNSLPRFKDRSLGVWRRLMVMPFRIVIPDAEQDEMLVARLEAELPGILNWALNGLHRLLRQGQFTRCELCVATANDHRYECDPIAQFVEECSLLPAGNCNRAYRITKEELYAKYRDWCLANGHLPCSKIKLGKSIAKLPRVVDQKRNGPDGRRQNFWVGIGEPCPLPLPRDEAEEEEDEE